MVIFSQTFVVYHGCGNNYRDGTRKIVPKNKKCSAGTYYPFCNKPIDVRNRVETWAQLKVKTKASRNYQKRYMRYVDVFSRDSFTSDDFSSDDELEGWSLANNASSTEQNLSSSDDESLASNASNTEQSLISDVKK